MNMEFSLIKWFGLSLSFLAAFFLSLLTIALNSATKISISRLLEDKKKEFRDKILTFFDELKISAEIARSFFLIASIVYLYVAFPGVYHSPLWFFLGAFFIYLVLFELIPRLIISAYSEKILSFFFSSPKIPFLLSKPLIILAKLRTTEKEPEEQREASEEEIQVLIDEAKEEGIIEKEDEILLKSVVEFGDTVVHEIMTPRVSMVCIKNKANIRQLRELVIKEKHSRIPVYKDRIDNIEGIIIAKDLLEYSADELKNHSLKPLVRPVYFIPESMKVSELLKEFQKRKQKLAIVIDEHGGVSGLVTMEDLMEEIVGEIQDEYDQDEIQIIKQGPGDYIVSGDAEVEKVENLFDLDLAKNDFITVGGLITHHLGRLPKAGEKIEVKGLSMEILEVGQKRIKKLRIRKQP